MECQFINLILTASAILLPERPDADEGGLLSMLSRLALECIVKEEDTSDLDDLDGLCREDEFLEFGDSGLDSGENAERRQLWCCK